MCHLKRPLMFNLPAHWLAGGELTPSVAMAAVSSPVPVPPCGLCVPTRLGPAFVSGGCGCHPPPDNDMSLDASMTLQMVVRSTGVCCCHQVISDVGVFPKLSHLRCGCQFWDPSFAL